jgi:mono/diheme cytochrome c family protein
MRCITFLAGALPVMALAACSDTPGPTQVASTVPPRGQVVAQATCAQCHGADYRGDVSGTTGAPDLRVVTVYTLEQFDRLLCTGVTRSGEVVEDDMAADAFRTLQPEDRRAVYDYLRSNTVDPTR